MSQTVSPGNGATPWKYGEVELVLDMNDVDTIEHYEKTFKLMDAESKAAPKDGEKSSIVRAYCRMLRNVFDRLFGEGTSVKLVGEKDNVLVLTECYESFLAYVTAQNEKLGEVQNRLTSRYSPNRAQRRASGS